MKKKITAFSLMEMMIVLLIISIVIAASAPMVNKKMLTSMAEKSPWVWTNTTGAIAYNINGVDNQAAVIGAVSRPTNTNNSRLYIENDGFVSQIALGSKRNGKSYANILYKGDSDGLGIGSNIAALGRHSLLLGYGSAAGNNSIYIGNANNGIVSVSSGTEADDSIAIGRGARTIATRPESEVLDVIGGTTSGDNKASIAIGSFSLTTSGQAIAIGASASASAKNSVAIGAGASASASASAENSVAIGAGASASAENSVAIGSSASVTTANTIVLGTADDTVVIPGKLMVVKDVVLAAGSQYKTFLRTQVNNSQNTNMLQMYYEGTDPDKIIHGQVADLTATGTPFAFYSDYVSDRRLKNVGKPFEGGVADIKKLEVFNFTFKKDTENTPHVGVMAQDLQKVFPYAVTKGKDGFLRIRFEDMFFAMVNAIQELSAKIDNIIDKEFASIKTRLTDIEEQNRQLIEQFTVFDAKIKAIVDKNAEIDAKILKVADKNTELENQLKEQNALLEKQNKALTEKNAELEKVVKECAENRTEIEKRIAALEKKLVE